MIYIALIHMRISQLIIVDDSKCVDIAKFMKRIAVSTLSF